MDIKLKCRCCGKGFIFTNAEIEHYKIMNYSPPRKCADCRKNPYADMKSVSQNIGLKQQDVENNPQNHNGFFRVGIPKCEGFALNGCFITVKIESQNYYLKIERMPKNTFSLLFLDSEDDASHFDKGVDIEYIKKLVDERTSKAQKLFEVQDYKLEYTPKYEDEICIDDLKSLKHLTEPMDIWRAKWHYEQCWKIHYYDRDLNLSDY